MTEESLWLDPAERRAWEALVGATQTVMTALDDELVAGHDLTLGDYEVFVHLSSTPDGRLRMAELAERLSLSPSGLTRRLDRLTRRGLVARERCASDRRGTFAVLTPAGRARLEEAAPTHVCGVRRHFLNHLSAAQQAALADALAPLARRPTAQA